MGLEFYYTLSITLGLIIWWVMVFSKHKRLRNNIKIRVHVYGTRGKSSVTRLITAAFREAGFKTYAKTTGTYAVIIFPDGHEEKIIRRGTANINEQVKFIELAATNNAEAIILECMALQPQYQELAEDTMIRSTCGVITNTRPDHLDVMGPKPLDVVDALSGMIPKNGILITSDEENLERLTDNAKKIGTKVLNSDKAIVRDEDLLDFDYIEHKENVALALKVADYHGIEEDIALRGMKKATPDAGALILYDLERKAKKLIFANAFAANDPVSTMMVWNILSKRLKKDQKFVIINNRADRQTRSIQLADFVPDLDADHYFVVGTSTDMLVSLMRKNGIDPKTISDLGGKNHLAIYDKIFEFITAEAFVVGIGNIGGIGHDLVEHCENKQGG